MPCSLAASVNAHTNLLDSDEPSGVEGFPLRKWNIQIFLLNEHGEEVPATIFSKALYKLHPSFDKRQHQSSYTSPWLPFLTATSAPCTS